MKELLLDLKNRFWAVPLACAVGAAVAGVGLTALDESLDTGFTLPLLFAGGPEGARSLLAAIITSMISFTGLVFSITIVVLQLTSTQFSPRVLRTFLDDRFNQLSLGVFLATFVYALVVLRGVRGTAQVEPFVPQVAVTAAFVLVMLSVLVFLGYIHHIAQSIRAATIVTMIAHETRELIEERFPADVADGADGADGAAEGAAAPARSPGGPVREVRATRAGVVQRVDDGALERLASDARVTIRLTRAVGEFVPAGAVLLTVSERGRGRLPHDADPGDGTEDDHPDDDALLAAVHLGSERNMDQDVGFGLRQLVDIAERALSPGVNDPTTAVQVLDQLHDLLRRLATRPLPSRDRVDDAGRILIAVPQPSFEDYLRLAVDEIERWGSDSDRVQRRIAVLLADLLEAASPAHRPAVQRRWSAWQQEHAIAGIDAASASDVGLR